VTPATDPPSAVAPAPINKPTEVVIVSRDTRNEVLASRDTPLALVKGARSEDALLRQAIFVTTTLTVVRPVDGTGAVLRWTYAPYLQRQLCFTSITGLFSCAGAEVEALTETAAGEAPFAAAASQPVPGEAAPGQAETGQPGSGQPGSGQPGSGHAAPGPHPAAAAARLDLAADLRTRAGALFDADRRLEVDPMLRAAGVAVRRAPRPAGPVRR
jgi:hypothetical protein